MSDLVDRLKGLTLNAWQDWPQIGDEAAAEITRLKTQVERLKIALRSAKAFIDVALEEE